MIHLDKKALIVGGSNGIGLAIAKQFISRGKKVIIVDKEAPQLLPEAEYLSCNLLYPQYAIFENLSQDESIDTLIVTAGIGRVANFENLHPIEIDEVMKINAQSVIKIIRAFYHRIKSRDEFYTCIMGSIAGLISSPMFSVYAASKAALCRFIESVNIELEADGYENRILNISPGSIKGTKFNGGNNDLTLTLGLADEILMHMEQKNTLYIPEYETVFSDVLNRYHLDSHAFGISSYEYKKKSGRVSKQSPVRIGYLSGTFDLFHIGHLNLLRRAKEHCDYLIVGVHPDAKHKNKKAFIPFEERMEIVRSVRYVDEVVPSCPEDDDAWKLYHYHRLFVGSDYKGTERFQRYEEFFKDKDVEIIYFPYTQSTNSTQIRKLIDDKLNS